MELGSHLNFRDPDGIALELDAPNDLFLLAKQTMASGEFTPAEIAAFVAEHLDPAYTPSSAPASP